MSEQFIRMVQREMNHSAVDLLTSATDERSFVVMSDGETPPAPRCRDGGDLHTEMVM